MNIMYIGFIPIKKIKRKNVFEHRMNEFKNSEI